MEPSNNPTILSNRAPWSDEIRALAYELWVTKAGRRLKTLEQLISEKPYEINVPYQTLWYWERHERWSERADADAATRYPVMRTRLDDMGLYAAHRALAYIDDVLAGVESGDRYKLAAAKLALEAGGATGVKAGTSRANPVTFVVSDSGLSDAARTALLAGLNDDSSDEPEPDDTDTKEPA